MHRYCHSTSKSRILTASVVEIDHARCGTFTDEVQVTHPE